MLRSLPVVSPSFLHDASRTKFPLIAEELETGPFDFSFGEVSKRDEDLLTGVGLAQFYATDSKSTSPFVHENKHSNMYLAHQHQHAGLSHAQLQNFEVPFSQPSDEHVDYSTASFIPQRPVDDAASYASNSIPQHMPKVLDWSPHTGMQGTKMVVMLLSEYELDPTWRFEMHFGDQIVPCAVNMTEARSDGYEIALSLSVPMLPEATYASQEVALTLEAKDNTGASIGILFVDSFVCNPISSTSTQSSPQLPRKRRRSVDTDDGTPLPTAKRLAMQQPRAMSESAYEPQPFGYVLQSPMPIDSIETPNMRPLQHPQTASVAGTAAPHMNRGHSQTPSWTPRSHAASASPQLSGPNRKAAGLSPIVVHPAKTTLIRTTTITSPTPTTTTPLCTPAPTSTFNPYAMYPYNKAQLKINGDLEDACKGWTKDENEAGRRLVRFWRNQSGSIINTSFEPVTPEERQPTFICISCIWWESKKEHYVTSVDTIYLLENLVGGRFTVEEKNRIRRNLEGFKPLTVSKGKSDSEDFFKLIMGFPNPKPRNIEKDVKVFQWKILAHALKKIMGKYSALPQATPSFPPSVADLATGGFAAHPMTPPSSSDGQLTGIYSPAPIPISYANMPPTSMAAAVSGGAGFPVYAPFTAPGPMVPMPSPAPSHHTPAHPMPHVPHSGMSAGPYAAPTSSWDLSGSVFMESPVSSLGTPMDPTAAAAGGAYYPHLHATPEA